MSLVIAMPMKDILVIQDVFSSPGEGKMIVDLENISIPEIQSTIHAFPPASLEQYSLLRFEHGVIAQSFAPVSSISVIWASTSLHFDVSDNRGLAVHSESILVLGSECAIFPVLLLHLLLACPCMSIFGPSHQLPPERMITGVERSLGGLRSVAVGPSPHHRIELSDQGFLWRVSVLPDDRFGLRYMIADGLLTWSDNDFKPENLPIFVP